ncbi:MAG TPA: hypothetical protein VHE55_14090 [Fimbriimonadaceae bacterium]|nr:hypothetical protein [Fimbriimonadaceae bacterium]
MSNTTDADMPNGLKRGCAIAFASVVLLVGGFLIWNSVQARRVDRIEDEWKATVGPIVAKKLSFDEVASMAKAKQWDFFSFPDANPNMERAGPQIRITDRRGIRLPLGEVKVVVFIDFDNGSRLATRYRVEEHQVTF